jgi:hypothetical protein
MTLGATCWTGRKRLIIARSQVRGLPAPPETAGHRPAALSPSPAEWSVRSAGGGSAAGGCPRPSGGRGCPYGPSQDETGDDVPRLHHAAALSAGAGGGPAWSPQLGPPAAALVGRSQQQADRHAQHAQANQEQQQSVGLVATPRLAGKEPLHGACQQHAPQQRQDQPGTGGSPPPAGGSRPTPPPGRCPPAAGPPGPPARRGRGRATAPSRAAGPRRPPVWLL